MARIRSIKPEIWLSPQVMSLSHAARLLFIGLITQADDDGRGSADPRRIKAAIFGGDDLTADDVRRMLDELKVQGLSVFYPSEKHGDLYALPSWDQHQSIDRKRPSAYPPPPTPRTLDESSTSPRATMRGDGRKEGSRKDGRMDPCAREDGPPIEIDNRIAFESFERIKAGYPNFAGRANWIQAQNRAGLLVERGQADWETLVQAVERYAAYCAQGGVSSPQYVLTPHTFFSADDEPWAQKWIPPPKQPTRAEKRSQSNADAAAAAREEIFGKKKANG